MIPADGPDAGGSNHAWYMDIRIVGTIWFLNEDRMVHDRQERRIIDAIPDPDRFDPIAVAL